VAGYYPATRACGPASLDDIMTTPTPAEMQVFAVAVGFLITGTFMRYVWKSPAQSRSRKRSGPPRD
jgi:hypothetical protein